jgi:hypothetical protein
MMLRNPGWLTLGGIGAVATYLRCIRPWQLRWGATNAEVERSMTGDDDVAHPTFNATRAVTVAARPEQIWPWLVQIGRAAPAGIATTGSTTWAATALSGSFQSSGTWRLAI